MKNPRNLTISLLVSIGFVIAAIHNYYSKPLSPFLFVCNTIGFVGFSTLIVVFIKQLIDIKRKS
ncbi:hypothetical protein [Streptococcus hyointestinalis]|uniref:hypothetical protein n=1 Tax=Streptococcus hyointestinalis TaxID=1337 RepID=UPI0013E06BA6|nr:hypothetical protein [Streptococcus hyointestinalis]